MEAQAGAKFRRFSHFLGTVLALPIAACVVGSYLYGSPRLAVAALRGDRLAVEDSSQFLGDVAIGESRTLTYKLTNLTSNSIKVVGSRASCKCTKVLTAPAVLLPRGVTEVSINYTPIENQAGRRYTGKYKLFVDDPVVRQIDLTFGAQVGAAPEAHHH